MLNCSITIDVSKRQLWDAIIDEKKRAAWWAPNILLEPISGGRYFEKWNDGTTNRITEGLIEEFYPNELLGITWKENVWPNGADSKVTFIIESEGLKSCVRLKHEPLKGFSNELWRETRLDFIAGWAELLISLRKYLQRCETQSSHDLVFKTDISIPSSEVLAFLQRHPFLKNSETLFSDETENSKQNIVLAWKGDDVHPVLSERGKTSVLIETKKSGAESTHLRIVHTGFGFSAAWVAAREWQDMAWKKFLRDLENDEGL